MIKEEKGSLLWCALFANVVPRHILVADALPAFKAHHICSLFIINVQFQFAAEVS